MAAPVLKILDQPMYISTLKKMWKHFHCVWSDKNLREMLLQHDNARPQDSVCYHTTWTDGVTASTLQPWLSTFIFSPLQTKLAASTGQGTVPVRHTCPRSTMAQSYRTAWRLHRKLEYITKIQCYVLFSRFLNKYLVKKKVGCYFFNIPHNCLL